MSAETDGYEGIVQDFTLSADWEMNPCSLLTARVFSIQTHIENTDLIGILTIELSNDKINWVAVPWITIDPVDNSSSILVSSETVATGENTDLFLQADNVTSLFYRLKFDWTSGSGVLNVRSKLLRGA